MIIGTSLSNWIHKFIVFYSWPQQTDPRVIDKGGPSSPHLLPSLVIPHFGKVIHGLEFSPKKRASRVIGPATRFHLDVFFLHKFFPIWTHDFGAKLPHLFAPLLRARAKRTRKGNLLVGTTILRAQVQTNLLLLQIYLTQQIF